MRQAAEGAFECEVGARCGQSVEFSQKQASGRDGDEFRFEERKAARNRIGIHKMDNARFFREELACESRFSGAVWPRNNDTPWVGPGAFPDWHGRKLGESS